jgi:hypothetical protein
VNGRRTVFGDLDGIHLDPDQQAVLGRSLAAVVAPLLGGGA